MSKPRRLAEDLLATPVRRPCISRADLLCAWAAATDDDVTTRRLAGVLGFSLGQVAGDDAESTGRSADAVQGKGPADQTRGPTVPTLGPLQASLPVVLAVAPVSAPAVRVDHADEADDSKASDADSHMPPLGPWNADLTPQHAPLVRAAQLWPALAQALRQPRDGGLDLPALVQRLGRAQPLQALPRARRSIWSGQLWVVLDRAEHLQPYAADMMALAGLLLRLHGRAGCVFWAVAGSPDLPLGLPVVGQLHLPRQQGRWPVFAPGATVVLLSDLGGLAAPNAASGGHPAWFDLIAHLHRQGCQPVVWTPAAPAQLHRRLGNALAVHSLQPGPALRRQRGRVDGGEQHAAEQQRLQDLLVRLRGLLSCCIEVDATLLRAVRLADPLLRHEPALESLYWQDTATTSRSQASRALRPAAAAQHRQCLQGAGDGGLPPGLSAEVAALMLRHHAALPRSTLMLELSLWRAHVLWQGQAGDAAATLRQLPADVVAAVDAAAAWVRQLGRHAAQLPTGDAGSAQGLANFARALLASQHDDAVWQRHMGEPVAALWALLGDATPPGHVPAQHLQQALDERRPSVVRHYSLVQHRGAIWLWPDGPLPPRASPIAEAWPAARVVVDRPAGVREVLQPEGQPCRLAAATAADLPITLHGDAAAITIALQQRPGWSLAWWRNAQGLSAAARLPDGQLVELRALDTLPNCYLPVEPGVLPAAGTQPPPGADARGMASMSAGADSIGLHVDLDVHGVLQRLRWIPPGSFWMGSPDDEPQRFDDEGPRHRVRLTRGLWLADTACTQALWQAVMGSNPARFNTDLQRPVEQVSFDDVQQFLARLQPLLPAGCQAGLPTEAEWEYACRAGTDTAFHFGATINRDQVNFDAAYDTPLAPRGEESETTVRVKSLPPNDWGLYEMHGNVWEWCDDHGRTYPILADGEEAEDPVGPQEPGPEAPRAVRGGTWFYLARSARSACRGAAQRRLAGGFLGFRFALRSTSPEAPEGPQASDR